MGRLIVVFLFLCALPPRGATTDASSSIFKPQSASLRGVLMQSSNVVFDDTSEDLLSLEFRKPSTLRIPLQREAIPIYREGKIASYKTSYSGVFAVGSSRQDFRVVFDTGSGNVVVPGVECGTASCRAHRRFNPAASTSARAVRLSGGEGVTIGFGTGQITGKFVRDRVCADSRTTTAGESLGSHCWDMNIVVATEMSTRPFKAFQFDGIFGLALGSLALGPGFGAFDILSKNLASPQFSFFLADEDGEGSELVLGGFDPARLLGPVSWVPVARPEHGHWQVDILAVRINGRALDLCTDGNCRAIVDTGTSHLGVPASFDADFNEMFTAHAGDITDCRLAIAPELEIEIPGFNITLRASNYMRTLPLGEHVSVSSPRANTLDQQVSRSENVANTHATSTPAATGKQVCRPRIKPVTVAAPLGPKLFIFGEPVLHKYHTVFDWKTSSIGFGLANTRRNIAA